MLGILIFYVRSLFLSLHTHSFSTSAGSFSVLSPNLKSPLVPETPVASDLEKSLNIFSEFGFKDVRGNLKVLSLLVIPLSVEEPPGNTVSLGISNQIGNGIALCFSEFSCPKFGVQSEDLADEEAKTSSDSLDLVQSEGDSALAINVGVKDTMDMLESVLCVFDDQ